MVRSLGTLELLAILAAGLIVSAMLLTGSLPQSWLATASVFALWMVLWIAVRDVRDFIVPDAAVVCLAMVAVVVRLGTVDNWQAEAGFVLLDAAACGGVFLLIREAFFRLRGYDGMGFGDVKLAAACGALVGYEGFAWAVFAASAVGHIGATLWSALRPGQRIGRLPFGALLAPACWWVWILRLQGAA